MSQDSQAGSQLLLLPQWITDTASPHTMSCEWICCSLNTSFFSPSELILKACNSLSPFSFLFCPYSWQGKHERQHSWLLLMHLRVRTLKRGLFWNLLWFSLLVAQAANDHPNSFSLWTYNKLTNEPIQHILKSKGCSFDYSLYGNPRICFVAAQPQLGHAAGSRLSCRRGGVRRHLPVPWQHVHLSQYPSPAAWLLPSPGEHASALSGIRK